MLSRLAAFRSPLCRNNLDVVVRHTNSSSSTAVVRRNVPAGYEVLEGHDGPERDVVNFPRLKRPIHPPKTRLGFLPDEWFQMMYPKTGVTGPYLFGTGLLTYLYSKEFLLMDHEFYTGVTMLVMFAYGVHKYGPDIRKYIDTNMEEQERERLEDFRATGKLLEQQIADEHKLQWQFGAVDMLIDIKRENIAMQLEAEFRKRQMQVYNEVKKRLDYQLEVVNIQRRLQQRHMVDWIVNNVVKGISAKQEKDMLAKCITDLKALAAVAAK